MPRWRLFDGMRRPSHGRVLLATAGVAVVALVAVWTHQPSVDATRMDGPASDAHLGAFEPLASSRPVPDLAFQDVSGATRHLSDFRGHVVLLNLWATWCTPCRAEMPTLDRLQSRLGGKDFAVVALSIDREGAPIVKQFFAETNVHALAMYVDPSMDAQRKLAAIGVPTTLLIDRVGREVARKTGPEAWDSAPVVSVIERYLPARRK